MKSYLKYFIPKHLYGSTLDLMLGPGFDPTLTTRFHNDMVLARERDIRSLLGQPPATPATEEKPTEEKPTEEKPEEQTPEFDRRAAVKSAIGLGLGQAVSAAGQGMLTEAGGAMAGLSVDSLKDSIKYGIETGDTTGAVMGSVASAGVAAANVVDKQLMGDKNFGAQSEAIDELAHTASSALMKSGNPYAMMAAAAIEGANFISKAAGQNVLGFDVNIDSSGYSSDLGHKSSKANRNWGAVLGLPNLNLKKIDAQLAKRNEQALMALKAQSVAEELKFEQEARMESIDNTIYRNNVALAGGVDTSLLVAKRGTVLNRIKHNPIKPHKVYPIIPVITLLDEKKEEIPMAKNGAKLEQIEVSELPNVIPSGAMHKNKNNLDLNITKKGIPVITVEDDSVESFDEVKEQEDTLVQHAEIEEAEIIFNKELTDFIEERRKKWHADKDNDICLEVGMRLAKEIVENTKDNTDVVEKSIITVENEIN